MEIELPARLEEGQVLVRMAASGICHTQLLEIEGQRGPDPFLPRVLGHEGSGTVEAIGSGVSRVSPGDHVVLSWIKGPGLAAAPPEYCFQGKKIHAGPITTFLERTVVSENRLTPISKQMPLDKAALLGCAIPTGSGVALHNEALGPESSIAIFGAGGGIGLNVVQGARLKKTGLIVGIDVSDAKLALAKKFGATHLLNAKEDRVLEKILKFTGGRGVDVAVEAAGRKETMELAHCSVRRGGGMAILIGNLPYQTTIAIDPFELICGKHLKGSWGGETQTEKDIPTYVESYLKGDLKIDELITHRFPLKNINHGLKLLKEGGAGRILVEF